MSTAGNAETVATAVSVTLLLVVIGAAVTSALAVRAARRRYLQLRRRLVVAPLVAGPRVVNYVMRSPAASPTWWTAQVDRRRLWRSVSAAEHAVATAKAAGAPVGDLPTLSRQLRRAAVAVDRALVATGRARTPASAVVKQRERDVRDSASRIYAAAMESLTTTASHHTSELARSVQIETEALHAGLHAGFQ
jgi:hypothetical protein